MPPSKRKASIAASTNSSAKKNKTDEIAVSTSKPKRASAKTKSQNIQEPSPSTDTPTTAKQFAEVLRSKAEKDAKKSHKVDPYCHLSNGLVLEDYDCMLNQTNIGKNNNKFYVIQVIEHCGQHYCFNRWGRVGEAGANALKGPFSEPSKAVNEFKKKFSEKTSNKWDNRAQFVVVPGKYTLIEMGDSEDTEAESSNLAISTAGESKTTKACTLDAPTAALVKLIFDQDMFQNAMQKMDLDTKKMPLGKISKAQIAKGFEALEKIEQAIKNKETKMLAELSSAFYTVIPHSFGRQCPPAITDAETLQLKLDMLTVLADIEVAQSMQKEDMSSKQTTAEVPNPLDYQYGLLECKIKLLDKENDIYKILQKYMEMTGDTWRKLKIIDVWEVDRNMEGERFAKNADISNRKLLWHGTSVAVVAAILKSGLRIMPHSGGRVGCGIYFASENKKSAAYVRPAGDIGIMFLNEVALGKEHHITQDDGSLRAPPTGFDSVVAKGRTEPDPSKDTTIVLDGKQVVVPQGPSIPISKHKTSSFSESEYLVYREDQCRIRYMLKIKF